MRPRSRWPDFINVVLGAWLFASSWVFGYAEGAASWNAWLLGAAIALAGAWAAARPASRGAEAASVAIGAWVFCSPWFLFFASTQLAEAWNAWIVGALVSVDASLGLARVAAISPWREAS